MARAERSTLAQLESPGSDDRSCASGSLAEAIDRTPRPQAFHAAHRSARCLRCALGPGSVAPARVGFKRPRQNWTTKFELRSPRDTTQPNELPTAHASCPTTPTSGKTRSFGNFINSSDQSA
ncbi:DUF4113 domain-containing protein [Methylorubrum extorquens]